MAKNNEFDNENELEFIGQEVNPLIEVSSNAMSEFLKATNLWDLDIIDEIMPEFYPASDLLGQVIKIHDFEWKESREFGAFVVASCQLPQDENRINIGFFSVPTITFFKGLDLHKDKVKFPFVIAIVGARRTYTFEDPVKYLAKLNK